MSINLFKVQDEKNVVGNLKRALGILNMWISKNVGSAEHTKAIKMQKIIIIEYLSGRRYKDSDAVGKDERIMAQSFRLV